MTGHILTIDLGTSGPKVAVFTLDGDYLDSEFRPVESVLVGDMGVEQRPADWWAGVTAAATALWERLDRTRLDLRAVSVTSQWSGTVPVDALGEPLHNAIIWMDARGAEAVRKVAGARLNVSGYHPTRLREWIRLTGGVPSLSGKDPVGHILWFQAHHPELARRTRHYLEPKDWLNMQLTGRALTTRDTAALHWVTDNRDPHAIEYHETLLRWTGLRRDQLPDLIDATDIVGDVTEVAAAALGIAAGLPVVGGTPDVQSATIGSGAVGDYEGHLYIGTSSWITCHVPKKKTNLFNGIASLPSPLPGRYFVADEQECAGKVLTWLRDKVLWPDDALGGGPPPEDALQRMDALAAEVPPGANGVIFTPWLNGERTPVDDHTIRASWHHLGLGATRADLVRAALEGVAFNTRWLLEAVEGFVKRPFPYLNFIGGGASSDLWSQILADVLGREIRQVADPIQANSRGAALLAALALGHCRVEELSDRVQIAAVYRPDPDRHRIYSGIYSEFSAIYKANQSIHRRLAVSDPAHG
jgi:xylulokinase